MAKSWPKLSHELKAQRKDLQTNWKGYGHADNRQNAKVSVQSLQQRRIQCTQISSGSQHQEGIVSKLQGTEPLDWVTREPPPPSAKAQLKTEARSDGR